MLFAIAAVLITIWLLGMVSGFTIGSFIHVLFTVAVVLLVVSLSQEVMIDRKLRHGLRRVSPRPDGKRRKERLTNQVNTVSD